MEVIQDIVEEVLLASPYKKTARLTSYTWDQHARIREMVSTAGVKLIDQYLESGLEGTMKIPIWHIHSGLNNYIASEVSKTYWLNKIYRLRFAKALVNGDMHNP